MKKFLSLGLIAVLLLAGGCGKKKKKDMAFMELDEAATHSSLALTQAEEESRFEDLLPEEDVDFQEIAFLDEQALEEELALAEAEAEADDAVEWRKKDDERQFDLKAIKFGFNTAELSKDEGKKLEEDEQVIRDAIEEGKTVIIQGHADQLGPEEYNLKLSMARAESVKSVLVERGVPAERLETVAFGNEMPEVWSDAEKKEEQIADLAPNRRVDFAIA